ncbi:MAG: protein kinase [Thermoflexales bacterium]|nr:protein kinase [Thermoflexales bacterium]
MDGMIGKIIGRYRIVEHLGRGGMAEVYKAYQASLDRYVAIKLMHTFLADEKEFLARFEREAKVVATLRHPNIVQVYDFDADQGVYYMVMEFINGETLKARLQTLEAQGEWVSLDDSVRIILAVGSALRYAHERNMVHRDVKPANVMITLEGQVILTDFGIAKIVSSSNLTASGAMVGTPSYMAPEQGMGQPGDERSDIYSLGVMLYQLVLGRLPFDADTPLAVVLKHINEPLPLPRLLKPDLSDALNAVILKSLAKEPNERYQKVTEMLADLRRAVGLPADETQSETTATNSSIKLSGATIAGRISGLTPPPNFTGSRPGAAATATQLASPQTVVAGGAAGAAAQPIGPAATPTPAPQTKRPGWIIPVIGLAVVAIIAVAVIIVSGAVASGAGQPPAPTLTPTSAPTLGPTDTPTAVPVINQLLTFKADQTPLFDKPDAGATVLGLLPQATQFHLRARTADSQWLRLETPDGVTGWVQVASVALGTITPDQLAQLPVATTLTKPTDTPTATPLPTDTATPTATPSPTFTASPTLPPAAATRVPPTPRPKATNTPPAPPPPPTPTTGAAIPLGYGFEFKFCTYDGDNYTCNVEVWGNGGDGKYHFALENPDTGNWEERLGRTTYLMRSRRCKTKTQQLRIWDESGNHIEPNLTMSPDDIAYLFPGGACTPPP